MMAPGSGRRATPIKVAVMILAVLAVAAFAFFILVGLLPFKPPAPTLLIEVSYSNNGNWTQNWTTGGCQRYNVTVSLSSPVNVTVTNVIFNYSTFDTRYVTGIQSEVKSLSLRVTEVEVSVTIEVDTCKGITRIDSEVCLTFEASVDVAFNYPFGSQTFPASQPQQGPELEVCA